MKPNKENQPEKKTPPRWLRWLKEIGLAVILLSVFSMGIDLWRSQNIPSDQIPELVASTIENQQIDLQAISREEPVLLYFWASWCAACKFVTPTVNWMANSHQVVSVAIRSGHDKRVSAYMNKHEYSFPVINDEQGKISQEWGITATPTIVIIKNGEIKSVTTGISTPPGLWFRMLLAG